MDQDDVKKILCCSALAAELENWGALWPLLTSARHKKIYNEAGDKAISALKAAREKIIAP